MLKLLSNIVACLVIALGVVHLSFSLFGRITENAVWFIGAGLAVIFGGFLNLIWLRNIGTDHITFWLCLLANLFLTLLFIFAAVVIASPPPFVGLFLLAFEIVAMVVLRNSKSLRSEKI